MTVDSVAKQDLELLGKYDTPTVCNVIELFNLRPRNCGYMDQRIRACFPELPPVVGHACTATFRSAAPGDGDVYTAIRQQLAAFAEVPGPPVIVFQDLDDPPAAATFGEVMCRAYKSFGAAGLITSGAGRDLSQVQAMQFPVFTSGAICAHGYCHIPSVQVPVHVGGVTVHPGELLHADRNGVTTLPVEIASEVAHACAEFVQAEALIIDYLETGDASERGFAEAWAACKDRIEKLRAKLACK